MRREELEKVLAKHSDRMKIIADAVGDNESTMCEVRLVGYQCRMLWETNFNQAREIDLLVKQKLKLQQIISKRKKKSSITINKDIQSGRPCIAGTGIPTDNVYERYCAMESIEELARDYGVTEDQIQNAIDYEEEK